MKLTHLFSPEKIGNVRIKNRIIRSATSEAYTEQNGELNDKYINFYSELAKGGTGLIITGGVAVNEKGSTLTPCAPCLYDDQFLPGQKKLVEAVHDQSECKIAAQLAHPGRQSFNPKFESIAPSSVKFERTGRIPKELKIEEIQSIIRNFVDTGRRAYEAGYDMVQFHGAHGFLLCNFLSPYTNIREDEYGGDTKGRTKILVDIYNLLRDEVGKSFPITIKLQTQDFVPANGLKLEEGKIISKIVADIGYEMIEVSGGGGDAMGGPNPYPSLVVKSAEEENYFLPSVQAIKPLIKNCKIALMGGIRNPVIANELIQNNETDFISISRPLIYEPDFPNRWESGDFSKLKCTNCNSCYGTLYAGGLYCDVKRRKQ